MDIVAYLLICICEYSSIAMCVRVYICVCLCTCTYPVTYMCIVIYGWMDVVTNTVLHTKKGKPVDPTGRCKQEKTVDPTGRTSKTPKTTTTSTSTSTTSNTSARGLANLLCFVPTGPVAELIFSVSLHCEPPPPPPAPGASLIFSVLVPTGGRVIARGRTCHTGEWI